jgi:hypothetical protein
MKKFILFLTFGLISCSVIAQKSLYQRIAIPALNFKVPPNAKSADIRWYCYDPSRGMPSRALNSYKQVHADGGTSIKFGNDAPMLLQDALSNGYIKLVENENETFSFINTTNKELHFVSQKPSLIGDVAGDNKEISDYVLSFSEDNLNNSFKGLWEIKEKIIVLNEKGYLNTYNPTKEQLRVAETKYKQVRKIIDEDDFLYDVSKVFEEIEFEKETRDLKIEIYSYHGLLKDGNPTKEHLSAADEAYNRMKNNSLSNYSNLLEDAEIIAKKKTVFLKDKLIEAKATNADVKLAEQEFLDKYKLKQDELNSEVTSRYNKINRDVYSADDLIYRISSDSETDSDIIKAFEKERGLEQTGDLMNSEVVETLAFYERNFRSFLSVKNKYKSSGEVIDLIKAVKKSLGLESSLTIDQATIDIFEKIKNSLGKSNYTWEDIQSAIVDGERILMVTNTPDFRKTQLLSYSHEANTTALIKEISNDDEWADVSIDKINGSIYLVNDKLVKVDDLYAHLNDFSDYRYHFGEGVDLTDVQSIIRTAQIKSITSGKNLDFYGIKITSEKFDFARNPEFRVWPVPYRENMSNLSFDINPKKLATVRNSTVGKVTMYFYNLMDNILSPLQDKIQQLFGRVQGNPQLDFSTELKSELAAYNIEISSVKGIMNNIEITIRFNKLKLDGTDLCKSDFNYQPR